jgi:hypothetical protein
MNTDGHGFNGSIRVHQCFIRITAGGRQLNHRPGRLGRASEVDSTLHAAVVRLLVFSNVDFIPGRFARAPLLGHHQVE